MIKASRAIACIFGLGVLHACVIFFAAKAFLPLPPSITDKYKRIPKADIQQKLVIVSDLSSHFGRDVATKLADLGFFVLGGVHTESDRRAFTGYNTIKGVETFVLNIADPMDAAQMSYRVNQISQKYNRSLYGAVIVDTFATSDESVPHEEVRKLSKLRKKLSQVAANEESNSSFTAHDREQLFHINTRHAFDIHRVHMRYQHAFQGPFRLLQVCHDLFSSHATRSTVASGEFRVVFLRPAVVTSLLSRKGSLFTDDLVAQSEAFLEAKQNDESAAVGLTYSLALVEYGALPPSTFHARSPRRRGTKTSRSSKSKKAAHRPSGPASQESVSTTSTPSAVSTDDVTLSILHALAARQPWTHYLLGNLKLNIAFAEKNSCLSWDNNTATCDASAPLGQSTHLLSLLQQLLRVAWRSCMCCLRRLATAVLAWAGVKVVELPLEWLRLAVEFLLPPTLAEYLWEEGVVPRLITVS